MTRSLESIDLFAEVPPDSLRRLAERCNWQSYQPGQQIVGHMESTQSVFFLTAGKARAVIYSVSGKSVTFRDVTVGDMFGELAAIDGEQRSASVEALEACVLAVMPSELFWEVLQIYPAVSRALMVRLTHQVRDLTERVFEFSTLAVKNRIHAELLRLARDHAQPDGTACLSPAPTHADIASRISTHREAVTRELNHLAHLDLIERRGNKLLILNVSLLERLVQEVSGH